MVCALAGDSTMTSDFCIYRLLRKNFPGAWRSRPLSARLSRRASSSETEASAAATSSSIWTGVSTPRQSKILFSSDLIGGLLFFSVRRGAALGGGLDDQRGQGEPADDPVPEREVKGKRRHLGRELGDDGASLGDLPEKSLVFRRIDVVQA